MELNTYPLVCTRGVVLYPNQEIVIDVGRETSDTAVENAHDNYDKKFVCFLKKNLNKKILQSKTYILYGLCVKFAIFVVLITFYAVKFRGIKRVKLNKWINGSLSDLVEVEILESEKQDTVEEEALIRMTQMSLIAARTGSFCDKRNCYGNF